MGEVDPEFKKILIQNQIPCSETELRTETSKYKTLTIFSHAYLELLSQCV